MHDYDDDDMFNRYVYKICTNLSQPQGELLYARIRQVLIQHCTAIALQLQSEPQGSLSFLSVYCNKFNIFHQGMSHGSKLFAYLVRIDH